GEILAMPEGSIAFPHEPVLRVTAPFREALLLESGLLHFISASTLIATKAARVVQAARGRPVAEFAFRRVQEPFIAARAASIGGMVALRTSCRRVLDAAGLGHVRIVASGDLDEHRIAELLEAGAPIDSFGVGTAFAGGVLGAVYKEVWLQEGATGGAGKIKL